MSYTLVLKEEADAEISEAYQWYEEQRDELGEEFLARLGQIFDRITENPELFPVKYKTQRVALLKRFPFLVVYKIEAQTVVVLAVFHTSRDPDEKYRE